MGVESGVKLSTIESPGKSGSHFFFSPDLKYVIKTINEDEFQFFRDNIYSYFDVTTPLPVFVSELLRGVLITLLFVALSI